MDTKETFVKIPVKGAGRDLKRYVWVHLIRIKGKKETQAVGSTSELAASNVGRTAQTAPHLEEATDYLKKVVTGMFDCPPVQHATLYYDQNCNPGGIHGKPSPDFLTMYRFLAVDYGKMKAKIMAHHEKVMAANPMPGFLFEERAHFYVENHRQEKHEKHGPMMAQMTNPDGKKYMAYGMSQWGGEHPETYDNQLAYADFYQEIRQHDVLRRFFGYENGHQWLIEEDEDWPEGYTFSIYEFFTDNEPGWSACNNSAYDTLLRLPAHADNGLYSGMYGGSPIEVSFELLKEY